MSHGICALDVDDLAVVSGGMNFDWSDHFRGRENVIDARGGSFTAFGMTVTYDLNGKVSSITQTPD